MLIIIPTTLKTIILFFQAIDESSSFDINQIATLVITAIITSSVTWLFTRKKENSDIAINESSLRRTDAETIILSGDKLINWIEKFEAAKTEAIHMEDEIAKLRRELDKCFDSRSDCKEFLDNMKESLDEIFSQLESQLKHLSQGDDILNELHYVRTEVIKKIEHVAIIEKSK